MKKINVVGDSRAQKIEADFRCYVAGLKKLNRFFVVVGFFGGGWVVGRGADCYFTVS